MPDARRCAVLLALLLAGCAVIATFGAPHPPAAAQFPRSDALYQVPGWTDSTPQIALGDGDLSTGALIQRGYLSASGVRADFVMWTTPEPQAKMLYRKGPDRDFLGAGYTTEPAPANLVPPIPGGGALLAHGPDTWLLLYTFGERRGRLGTSPLAWGAAEMDALLDRPNNYFLARVGVRFDAAHAEPTQAATQLAQTLFDRLAQWYASA